MAKRKIIKIDEDKCTGCGLCIPNCPEGALQIIDNKARLISDLFCDGLGACIGHCPEGAIDIEEREAGEYSERKVMENIIKQGPNVIKAHLEHLKDHGEKKLLKEAIAVLEEKDLVAPALGGGCNHGGGGCPGSKMMDMTKEVSAPDSGSEDGKRLSQLRQWPIQISLVPPSAPYLDGADLLIAADCVPFTYADFHKDLLKGKVLLVGCPKLDDTDRYKEKFAQVFKQNNIKSITYARMEVPCCGGMIGPIEEAISESGKDIPFKKLVISIKGDLIG
jgi:ferredoxin